MFGNAHQTSTSTFVKVKSLSRRLLSEKDGSERSGSPESLAESDFKRLFSVVLNNSVGRCGVLKIETVAQDLAEWIGEEERHEVCPREQDLRDLKRGLTLKINSAASTGDLITSINFARLLPSLERVEALASTGREDVKRPYLSCHL